MARSIRNNDLNAKLLNNTGEIRKFPGQTAEDIAMYEECLIKKYHPDKIVIIAGTNDYSYAHREGTYSAEKIADTILTTGRIGKKYQIPVVISGLFPRRNQKMNRCSQEVNNILSEKCGDEGFTYMDTSEIKQKHLSPQDGLHLGKAGSEILLKKLLATLEPQTRSMNTQPKSKPLVNLQPIRYHNNNNMELEEISEEESEYDESEDDILNIRPGPRSYSETVDGGDKTIIFSNSITKDVDVKRFNDAYDRGTAEFIRYPGRKARQLQVDIRRHLEEKRPNCVILQSGGNDLPLSTPVADIVDDLLDAAALCKRYGVEKICIGGVITRPGLQGRCIKLNEILERRCRARNYIFVNNNYIFLGHLYDNVHLDNNGIKILADNYLEVLNTAIVRR
jgi:lysophospholipase L1-like esterase